MQHINGEGPDAPGRNNNCVDTALSTVDTYAGNPTAAGARTPDPDADGTPSDRGERGGRDRIENTLGARFSDMGNGRDAFNRLENTLRQSGHGSQAVIITQDSNGRAHAWNAVNHNGKITYIDAQTGRTSPNPLHSGNNGVFAIPLDSDRQPVTSTRTTDTDSTAAQPERRPDSTPTGTDRRPPDDPAGAPQDDGQDSTPERPRGSAPYDTAQSPDDTHYDMLPEPSQAALRDSNDVFQTDLQPVYDSLDQWSSTGELQSLLRDGLADEQGGVRKETLENALTGFRDLTEGQQSAVVAALARMDLAFHATSAVGTTLDPDADNPHSPQNFQPKTDDAEKLERSQRARDVIQNLMDKAGIKSAGLHYHNGKALPGRAALEEAITQRVQGANDLTADELSDAVQREIDSLKDHKGDWSRKNFAVVEVLDPENSGEIRYVVDSSLPMSSAWGGGVHSEPHAMEWIKSVNQRREDQGLQPYEPISLYTEREPCGPASGNDCSDYLGDRVEGGGDESSESGQRNKLRIHYGVGFRRGQMDPDVEWTDDKGDALTEAEAKKYVAKQFSNDFVRYVNHLKSTWRSNATGGL